MFSFFYSNFACQPKTKTATESRPMERSGNTKSTCPTPIPQRYAWTYALSMATWREVWNMALNAVGDNESVLFQLADHCQTVVTLLKFKTTTAYSSLRVNARRCAQEMPITCVVRDPDLPTIPGPSPIPCTSGVTRRATPLGITDFLFQALLSLSLLRLTSTAK